MKVWRWIRRYWYVPIAIITGVLGFFVGRGRGAGRALERELAAIDAGELARLDAIDRGSVMANRLIDSDYRDTIAKLDASQAEKADRMRSDPGARAKWLTRLAAARKG